MAGVFEVSTLFEQQRQGDITRKLAAWAAILAVPTAIAGIYGMNFAHMPELTTAIRLLRCPRCHRHPLHRALYSFPKKRLALDQAL